MKLAHSRLMSAFGFALLLGFPLCVAAEENPAAEGFDAAGSDVRAVEIADEVMEALGDVRPGTARVISRGDSLGTVCTCGTSRRVTFASSGKIVGAKSSIRR